MKELPVALGDEDVRAILDGTMTQIRRAIRPQPEGHHWEGMRGHEHTAYGWKGEAVWSFAHTIPQNPNPDVERIRCPFGADGDALWVRETWAYYGGEEYLYQREPGAVCYRASYDDDPRISFTDRLVGAIHGGRWRPSIHMPQWASRITIGVTSVRAERLHAVTAEDILAEGVRVPTTPEGTPLVDVGGRDAPVAFLDPSKPRTGEDHLRAQYASRWSRRYGRASWDANPWTWVANFTKHKVRSCV